MTMKLPAAREALSGILSGVSGEYFVAAELSRMGYIASIKPIMLMPKQPLSFAAIR